MTNQSNYHSFWFPNGLFIRFQHIHAIISKICLNEIENRDVTYQKTITYVTSWQQYNIYGRGVDSHSESLNKCAISSKNNIYWRIVVFIKYLNYIIFTGALKSVLGWPAITYFTMGLFARFFNITIIVKICFSAINNEDNNSAWYFR